METQTQRHLHLEKPAGNEGVTRQQEPQGALVKVSENNWGYLTPGWGAIDGRQIDFPNYIRLIRLLDSPQERGFTVILMMLEIFRPPILH